MESAPPSQSCILSSACDQLIAHLSVHAALNSHQNRGSSEHLQVSFVQYRLVISSGRYTKYMYHGIDTTDTRFQDCGIEY